MSRHTLKERPSKEPIERKKERERMFTLRLPHLIHSHRGVHHQQPEDIKLQLSVSKASKQQQQQLSSLNHSVYNPRFILPPLSLSLSLKILSLSLSLSLRILSLKILSEEKFWYFAKIPVFLCRFSTGRVFSLPFPLSFSWFFSQFLSPSLSLSMFTCDVSLRIV